MTDTIRLGARLRAARKAAGFKTSKAFLKKYKVPASTYSQHESGARVPDDAALSFYSKAFEISFEWLKHGKGHPFSMPSSKNSVLKDELFDLTKFKKKFKETGYSINQVMLTNILEQLLSFHQSNNTNYPIATIVKDAVSIYSNVSNISCLNKNQQSVLNKAIRSYKNKLFK